MQSGEDHGIETEWPACVFRRIKHETLLGVTLSPGERPDADLAAWRERRDRPPRGHRALPPGSENPKSAPVASQPANDQQMRGS